MKTRVVYYTKSGNTKKIAEAIAQELNTEVSSMEETMKEQIDVLFLGASVYKMGVDKKVLSFVDNLSADDVKNVVIFSTSAIADSGYQKLKKRLTNKGINVDERHFHCKGEFIMLNKNRPNCDDVNEAKKFASSVVTN